VSDLPQMLTVELSADLGGPALADSADALYPDGGICSQ
jgi:hypothetical protein